MLETSNRMIPSIGASRLDMMASGVRTHHIASVAVTRIEERLTVEWEDLLIGLKKAV